jgi:hypothetical protein
MTTATDSDTEVRKRMTLSGDTDRWRIVEPEPRLARGIFLVWLLFALIFDVPIDWNQQ